CAFWPSSVLVWSHASPRAIRSAPGVATTPYRPGIRLAMTAWPASGDKVVPFDSYLGQVTIVPVMPNCVGSRVPAIGLPLASNCGPIRETFVTGHASRPVAGSIVPARLFTSGWLNMSYVICPVASPVPPASSNSTILKPPSPASFGASTSTLPPPSCSPFSGKSSWNTNTDSFEGGYGSGSVTTVSGVAEVGKEQVVAGGVIVHRSGAPAMPCPQAPG